MSQFKTLVDGMIGSGAFETILRNPRAQFGLPGQRLLGATLLPERAVLNNSFTEWGVRYRTPIANDAARYSPPTKKGGFFVGKVEVRLVDQDIAADYTSEDYDAHIAMAQYGNPAQNAGNPTLTGAAGVENWFDARINRPLIHKNDLMRWQAIVDAECKLAGANGYEDTLKYPNPPGHRFVVAGQWSDNNYDILANDIFPLRLAAAKKGNTLRRLIMSSTAAYKFLGNGKVRAAIGGLIVINSAGALQPAQQVVSLQSANAYLAANQLPAIEIYDELYQTQAGSFPFLKRDVFVAVCSTGRDNSVSQADGTPIILPDTLGYHAIGRAAGQPAPGRATDIAVFTNKPPRIEAQGWQTSAPVITDPEAIYVGSGIA